MTSEIDIGFVLDSVGDRPEEAQDKVDSELSGTKLSHTEALRKFRDQLLKDHRCIGKDHIKNTTGNLSKSLIQLYKDEDSVPKQITNKVIKNSLFGGLRDISSPVVGSSSIINVKQTSNISERPLIQLYKEDEARKKNKKPKLQKEPKRKLTSLRNQIENESKTLAFEVTKALEKAVVTPDFETLKKVPKYQESKRTLKRQRKEEREKTKGKDWFNLPATEMTDEIKQDLEVLQMRSVLDPKHFYKKNDLKVLPKYFQIGKVMDSPLDFYNNRLTKKERKKTLVDELLADAEFQKFNKRKYKEILEEKQKTHYKSWRKAKNLKKKKK